MVLNQPQPNGNPNYEYVPSIMQDGVYRMWFCQGNYGPAGQYYGDRISLSTATSLSGPWSAATAVFLPSGGSASNFDYFHVCDPSVVRVNGVYYMYYGGHNNIPYGQPGHRTTAIGVATSTNGTSWTRMNGGAPIITAFLDENNPGYAAEPNKYGAGQPSVVFLDGYFYLAYTDTTGFDSNPVNGAGIYVLRSTDPTFQSGVEELTSAGFETRTALTWTRHSIIEAFSVDIQFSDMVDGFAIVDVTSPGGIKHMRVSFFNRAMTSHLVTSPLSEIYIAGDWSEGPGIVSRPDKHSVPSATNCDRIPIDIIRSVGASVFDGLAHVGVDINTGLSCSCARLPKVFEDQGLAPTGFPWAIVKDGQRLHFQLLGPMQQLTKNFYPVTNTIYSAIPGGASMFSGDPVYYSTGTPGAFYLNDGRLWPVSCLAAVTANNSSMTFIPLWQWSSYPIGPALFCVQ
ncbi:beta-xylosidase [Luteitalea sp. TBR-22]|nr:beta-xylosidase [Luteitalea sp. TBR-22]